MFWFKLSIMFTSNFYPLEVVGRSSKTQLQAGENKNFVMQRFEG